MILTEVLGKGWGILVHLLPFVFSYVMTTKLIGEGNQDIYKYMTGHNRIGCLERYFIKQTNKASAKYYTQGIFSSKGMI